MTCSVCRSFNSISLRHYSLEYCKCRAKVLGTCPLQFEVPVKYNYRALEEQSHEPANLFWQFEIFNIWISFTCVLLYFWHDLLVPKTLEAHLTSFTKNKEIGSSSVSFREGPKMSKRQNSISCRTFQGPFDLRTTMESGLQLWKCVTNIGFLRSKILILVECTATAQFHSSIRDTIFEKESKIRKNVEIIAKSHFYSPAKQSALLSARAFRERRTRKSRRQQSSEYFFWRVSFAHLVLSKSPKVKEEVSRKKFSKKIKKNAWIFG